MHTTTGTIIISRQVFQFEDGGLIVTEGAELADYNVAMPRVITGGLGDFAETHGVMLQANLGMSDGMGVRAQFEIDSPDDKVQPHVDG